MSTAPPNGVLKRFVTSLCGVLAQFGGVALAFAFLATFSAQGFLTRLLGTDGGGLWLYEWDKGLMLVYLYFQMPAHAHRVPARGRGAATAVARGDRDPRRDARSSTGARSPARS